MRRFLSDLAGTMQSTFKIGKVYAAPTANNEAAPKKYVDDSIAAIPGAGFTTEYFFPLNAAATFAVRWANMPSQYKPAGWSMVGADDINNYDTTGLGWTAGANQVATSLVCVHNTGKMVAQFSIMIRSTTASPYTWRNFVNLASDMVGNTSKTQFGIKGITGITASTDMTLLIRLV